MITINKAIERLETFIERHPSVGYSDLIPAIERALKSLYKEAQEKKGIGQLIEEENLAIFKRAGIKARAVTSVLYSDGSSKVLYEKTNRGKDK